MLLRRSLLLAAPTLALLSRAAAYIVTTEKWEPDALLVPGKTLFYNVVVEARDTVVLVDVILANGILGNTSDIFANSDLRKKDDANAGFDVPFVPPGKQYTVRLVETATKKFLADSPQFEIFAVNGVASSSASSLPATTLPPISQTTTNPPGGSSIPPTSLPPLSKTASSNSNSASPSSGSSSITTGPSPSAAGPNTPASSAPGDAIPVTGDPEPKSKTPVGAIAGGVVGGLFLIGLVVFFLLWRRRQHQHGSAPTALGGTDNEKATHGHGHGLASPGPHAVEPYTLPPSAVRPGAAGLGSTASLTGTGTDGGAGPLPSKLGYGFAMGSSSSQGGESPLLSPGTTRVEQLRLERERINRELAALEHQRPGAAGSHTATTGPSSSGYGGGASSYMPPSSAASGSRGHQESALAEQLAVLQTQIRQLEERQQRRESDAPPMYDGPPAAGSVSEPQYPVPPLLTTDANMSTTSEAKAARRARFEGVFAKIRDELLEHFAGEKMPAEAVEWYRNNLNYNVPGGKLNRGMSVVDTVEILKGRALTEDEYFKAAVLGWCVELLQAYFLVADDMMDASITRRGQPCWYRVEEVGMIAINDSFMLEAAIYRLLKVHFRAQPYYADLLDLFHETTYQTEMGQLIDLITAPEDRVDLNKFSLDRHHLIVVYKTAYYSFYLPVALALLVSGVPETYDVAAGSTPVRPYDVALSILIPLGEYFQIQDDFLDFSGTPEQIGKIGTDIVDNKCSWVVNTAIKHASPAQRQVLDDNYGRKDAAKEQRVKALFEELDIRGIYAKYEEGIVGELNQKIDQIVEVDGGLKREVFRSFLSKIYKRSK
ncbi:hypothetical protein D9619_013090 [Psilocybe cf. subviscida]|uniref:(2E,6E)-farnesyl diphosphate synthase n=1 Tax=Psilocybe cf. subviscida TaxID=2480587 RepID=A0A8H5AZB0_9AGAR|nr:hypothetical protein D9619_013090 [Psilocybe cf. subviscida]